MESFVTSKSRGTKIKNTANKVFFELILNSVMQQWNKGVTRSTCINIMLMCGKLMHPVEQSKSGKASLVYESCMKAEEQICNRVKVGVSHLSDRFLKRTKILGSFFHYQYFVNLDKITPFSSCPQKEKIISEVKILLRLKKSYLQT